MSQLVLHFFQKIWQGRTKKIVLGTVVLLVLLMLLSWLALPSYVKQVAGQQVQQQLGRKLEIAELSFSPLTLTLSANGVRMFEPDNTTPALTIKNAVFSLSIASVYHRALVMDEILLDQVSVHVVRTSADDHGHYNFSDILDRVAAMPKSETPFRFSLANVQLQNGAIQFDDQVLNKHIALSSVQLGLPFMSNFPSSINSFVQPRLSAKINGTTFSLNGRSKPFVDSLETSLAIDIDHLDLASYVAYVPVVLPVQLDSAKLTTKLDLTFSRKNKLPEVLLSGSVLVDALALQDKQKASLIKLARFEAHIQSFNLSSRTLKLDKLILDTPEVWASMDEKGVLNWASLGNAPTAGDKPVATAIANPDENKAAKPLVQISEILLQKGSIHFADGFQAAPLQTTHISDIKFTAKQFSTAPNTALSPISLSANLGENQSVQFDGQFNPLSVDLKGVASLANLQLELYQNYVNRFLLAKLNGKLSVKSQVNLEQGKLSLSDTGIELQDFKLQPKAKNEGQIAIKSLAVDALAMSTEARTLTIGEVKIANLDAEIRRDNNSKLNLQKWLVPAKSSVPVKPAVKPTETSTVENQDWKISLASFGLSASNLAFIDQSVSPNVNLKLEGVAFSADQLSSDLSQTINMKWASSFNRKGKLNFTGSASPQLRQILLNLDGQYLPVAALSPYFSHLLNVELLRGSASSKAKISILNTPNKPMQSTFEGGFSLNDFQILEKGQSDDFLHWKSISLEGINASVGGAKQFVNVRKLDLNDFFAKVILSDKAKLNLSNIVVHESPSSSQGIGANPESASRPNEMNPQAPTKKTVVNSLQIRVGQTVLRGGNINFTDNFIKPNYTANLTGVAGNIGSISSDKPESASVQLAAKIDNDAPVLVSGTLNPLSTPIALDIKASATGIQLTRMSQYSEKYAGYAIAKGHLTVQLAYRIENDKLQAENEIRLDQFTFGEKKDSPDATKLPVNLALSLLKDNDGLIAINVPISGSLSDPQFSVSGVIFKVIGNLITKAITSPFAFLGSAFGGGDELAYIEFAPGTANLSQSALTKLDGLAKALKERSKLRVEISGRGDPETDSAGLKLLSLDNKIRALKIRDAQKKDPEIELQQVSVDEADRHSYIEDVYRSEKFEKPRNLIGVAKTLPPEEAKAAILKNTVITPEALSSLAQKRSDVVFEYLVRKGEVSKDRLFLIAPKLSAEGISDKGAVNRVDFSLK
ncbi:DUF748 domain-containing protein [Undibacterium sp. Ren11W]|uniref:DUF748 domain-containing protein n=1 Tax=Undibacterium sp. Ren11W TaxID=3413045 RepID=UPI003BF22744